MVADGLGVALDDVVDSRDVWYTPAPITTGEWRVEAGTVAAIRFEVAGLVAGVPRVTLEHVTRLALDAAPAWPKPPGP